MDNSRNEQDLSSLLLHRIAAEKVKPIPHWMHLLRHATTWALFCSTLLVGGFAIGLGLQALWPDASPRQGMHFREMTLSWLPLLWVAFAVLSGLSGIRVFRHFRYGYRARPSTVLLGALLASAAMGVLVFQTNGAFVMHRALMNHVKPYGALFDGHRKEMWSNPSEGRLSGTVTNAAGISFVLTDWKGQQWQVDAEDDLVRQARELKLVRVAGRLCGEPNEAFFCAERVMPWRGGGKGDGHGMGTGEK